MRIRDMLSFVEVQWMILQQSEPKDYVIATGEWRLAEGSVNLRQLN